MGYEIDFISVGSGESGGDAIALRFGDLLSNPVSQTVVVIDGGYTDDGQRVIDHISEFYGTSTVDLVISTHPDNDHSAGLATVLEKLTVGQLWMHLPWNHTDDIARMFKDGRVTDNSVRDALKRSLQSARDLEKIANRKGIPIVEPFQGACDATMSLTVLSPTATYYESLLPSFRGTPEPAAAVKGLYELLVKGAQEVISRVFENWGYETLTDPKLPDDDTSAENNSSTVLLLDVDGQLSFFTSDAGVTPLNTAADYFEVCGYDYKNIKFYQIPHHGSRRNVGPTLLNRIIGPTVPENTTIGRTAFVSAAWDGGPKHPAKKVLNAYKRRGVTWHWASEQIGKTGHGSTIRHNRNSPDRPGWTALPVQPLFNEVDE